MNGMKQVKLFIEVLRFKHFSVLAKSENKLINYYFFFIHFNTPREKKEQNFLIKR